MAISKSSLEAQRWYRAIKALFLLFPVAAIIYAIYRGRITLPDLNQKAIVSAVSKNVLPIVYRIGGIIGYYIVWALLGKMFGYIIFGGAKDNGKTKIAPMKQSVLEKKWRYRVLKVLIIILPIALLLYVTIKGDIILPKITQKNILKVFEDNIWYLGGAAISYVLYIGIINAMWYLIMYVGFGGLINDTRKIRAAVSASSQQAQQNDNGFGMAMLIILIMFIIGIGYNQTGTHTTTTTTKIQRYIPNPTPTCIPTGCGRDWRSYCTNRCYPTQSECMQAGNCSNTMCRQCP